MDNKIIIVKIKMKGEKQRNSPGVSCEGLASVSSSESGNPGRSYMWVGIVQQVWETGSVVHVGGGRELFLLAWAPQINDIFDDSFGIVFLWIVSGN